MNQITFNDKDLLVMKLLHYFITIKGYNPIILRGVNNEIWLENMEGPYNIIRINTGYIHNNEQFDFDMFKTKRIMDKIKFKTFSFSLNALSFFLDLGDNVDLKELEKFGFKPKYDENTGKIKAYEKVKKEKEYMGLSVTIETIKSKIRIFRRTDKEWRINPYNEHFDEDTLYDLIKADLVEKEGE